MTKSPRKPRIIKLEETGGKSKNSTNSRSKSNSRKPRAQSDLTRLKIEDDDAVNKIIEELEVAPSTTPSKGFSWGTLLFGALAGLISLGMGLAIDQLIRDLFSRYDWLGWLASGLTLLLAIAAFAIILREIWGISRLNTITRMRKNANQIASGENTSKAAKVVSDLESLYSSRPDLNQARANFAKLRPDILDGQDLLALFETRFMSQIDIKAKTLVMQSTKRVSLVTAISPRALVDIIYVLMENIRLISNISKLYGGRPGTLGFWRLTRNVLGHLAVTGAIAAGDNLIQQFVGHGVAARLSTKLGEGVINGLLTARIGIAAMDQARPMQFHNTKRPGLNDFFTEISRSMTQSKK